MSNGMLLFAVICFILIFSESILSATYYVDAITGNNANSGLQTTSAWKTINKVNTKTFLPGDMILFKRGQKWREQLDISSSGTSALPIVIGAYDTGVKPIISGANVIGGFDLHAGNVWKNNVTNPQQVYFNGIRGFKQTSLAAVNSDKEWFYDTTASVLYLYSIGNPEITYLTPGIEITTRLYCVNLTQDYITIQNLQLEKTSNSLIKITSFASNIIMDNLILYQWSVEQNWEADGDGIPAIGGIDIYGNNCEVKNSEFGKKTGDDIGDQGWAGFVHIHVSAFNTRIHHNNIYHNAIENETKLGEKAYGIRLSLARGTTEVNDNYFYHTGGHAIVVRTGTFLGDTIRIYNNTTEYTGQAGVSAYVTRREDGKGGIGYIYNNHISFANRNGGDVGGNGNQSAGIHLNDGAVANTNPLKPYMKWYVYDNIIHDNQALHRPNGQDSDGIGIDFNANEVEIFRNLIYNNWGKGLYLWNANRCKVFYNIIYGNDAGTTVTAATGTIEKADSNRIYNNTYYKNFNTSSHGPNYHTELYFGGNGKFNLIKNNIFYGHDSGTVYTFRDKNTIGCITDNNIVYKDAGNFAYITETKTYITFSQWRTTYPQWDAASVNANPQFKNAAGGDFSLNPGSPAINRGVNLGFTIDFYKNSLQGLPDIGAIELIDITPPAVQSVSIINATSIKVVFSEKVATTSAQLAGNYSITNGVSVTSSVLNAQQTEATLTTSSHTPNQTFILTISNVKDLAGNNISPPGNTYSYTYLLNPGSSNVILISAMSGVFTGDARLGSMTGMKSTRVVYFQGTAGGVSYNVSLPKTGKWYAWARMYYMSSGGKNSFFLSMNNTQYILGDNDSKYNQWHWDGYIGKRIDLGELNSGSNNLKISGREPGLTLWVDQIVLTDDSNYVGSDTPPAYSAIVLNAMNGVFSGDARLGTMTGMKSSRVVYFQGTNGGVTFNVNIPKTGDWYVWARMYYMSSGGKNSFFFNIKNTNYILGDNDSKYNQWHWDGYLGNKISVGTLTAGANTFKLSGREPGLTLWIDQVVFTDDPNYNPNLSLGKEGLEEDVSEVKELPASYELTQNYPNPFNPSTMIRYSLPEDANVKIAVYDVLGNEVVILVDEHTAAGNYDIHFNAVNLATGVYYYSIKAGTFYQVKKMILLK